MTTYRRRSYFSKPNFQLKLTIIFMLVVTIVANLVGGICYIFISETAEKLLRANPDLLPHVDMVTVGNVLVPKILLAEAIALSLVFILSILITHTIAGPVYRLERTAQEIARGNLSITTRLRPKDELKELADAFNEMTLGLARRIRALRQATKEAEARTGKDLTEIHALLDEFKLPETVPGDDEAPEQPEDPVDLEDEDREPIE